MKKLIILLSIISSIFIFSCQQAPDELEPEEKATSDWQEIPGSTESPGDSPDNSDTGDTVSGSDSDSSTFDPTEFSSPVIEPQKRIGFIISDFALAVSEITDAMNLGSLSGYPTERINSLAELAVKGSASDANEICSSTYVTTECRYVAPAAAGTGDGSSWENAMSPEALSDIGTGAGTDPTDASSTKHYVYLLKEGTYKPTSSTDLTVNRTHSLNLGNYITIIGGFLGEGFTKGGETVISGDINVEGDETDNSITIFKGVEVNPTSILARVTVQDGYGSSGVGMNLSDSSPIILNTKFRNNIMSSSHKSGAGILNQHTSTDHATGPLVILSEFTNNGGKYDWTNGGAIASVKSKLRVVRSKFLNNYAWHFGAAIYNKGLAAGDETSDLTIVESYFEGNKAGIEKVTNFYPTGFGTIGVGDSRVFIRSSTFKDNLASGGSGAIMTIAATIYIDGSSFFNNTGKVGALFLQSSDFYISNSTFIENKASHPADESQALGGALFYRYKYDAPYIVNSVFLNNTANGGGNQIYIQNYNDSVTEKLVLHNVYIPDGPNEIEVTNGKDLNTIDFIHQNLIRDELPTYPFGELTQNAGFLPTFAITDPESVFIDAGVYTGLSDDKKFCFSDDKTEWKNIADDTACIVTDEYKLDAQGYLFADKPDMGAFEFGY